MQPEQPMQNSSPDPSGSPRNVPEYLHMEPVEIKPPKSKKKIVLVVAAILVVLLAVGAAAYTVVMQQTLPQRRFDMALDNLLRAPYVTRERTVSVESTDVLTAKASTDFTNASAPKSSINYHFVSSPKSSERASPNFEAAGDIVVLKDKDFYGRLTTAPPDILPTGAKLDTWYSIDKPTSTTKTNTAVDFDFLKLRNAFNTVYGLLPLGSLNDDDRQQIASYIKSHQVYKVTGTSSDKQLTMYTVKIDYQELDGLNQKLADLLGIDHSKLIFNDNGKPLTMWVDNATNKIVKLKSESGLATYKNAATVEETFTYPAALSVDAPDAIHLP